MLIVSSMNEPIIQIRGIGKKYNIAHAKGGYVALRDVLTSIAKNPFRFFKQKAKEATGLAKAEEFWALRDVSLDIHKGEIVGIIGSNGAGKSTLLKILTGITPPTEGEIRMKGRVASLLEVGTGFHPELTGRENIFLNGAILGMTKNEIASKFDEIVAFAGIEKFLDTPVKRYSSGMYVRLAFSVAAHMEPDILLVDEVLAVGDAEFQKKCLGKMEEVTKTAGRTILFVSHSMRAIQKLCTRCILLEKGGIKMIGDTASVIKEYLRDDREIVLEKTFSHAAPDLGLSRAQVTQIDGERCFLSTRVTRLELEIYADKIAASDLITGFTIYHEDGQNIMSSYFNDLGSYVGMNQLTGLYKLVCEIPENFFNEGCYRILFDVGVLGSKKTDDHTHYLQMVVKNIDGVGSRSGLGRRWRNSAVLPYLDWSLDSLRATNATYE